MNGKTTWSTFHDGFEMVLVGGDVTFQNVYESPTTVNDGNPAPQYLVIPVGCTIE